MACYDTYRDQLASLYYGHALWVPDPSELYDRVRVGDVGYVKQGHFLRMFNALLPANDATQEYGVPEGFVSLNMGPFKNIRKLNLFHGDYCSNTVTVNHGDKHQAAGPDEDTTASFRCSRSNKGAFLSLPLNGVREDAIRTKAFESYIRKHCDSWLEFASANEIDVRLEDIIFVTGCDLTASWAMAAFVNSLDPEVSLNVRVSEAGSARFQWAPTSQPHHNEPNQNVVKSHCVFIRGFRAKRILPFFKTLRAAAGPRPDNPDNEPESSIELLREPAIPDYRDPLIGILDYIAEQCPDHELAIAHEDDLKRIGRIDVLTADAVESFLRQNEIPVQVKKGVALLVNEDEEEVPEEKTSFHARADVDGKQHTLIIHPVLMKYLLKIDLVSQPPDFDLGLPTEELLSSAVHPPVHLLVLENERGLLQNFEVHASDERSEIGVTIEDVLKTLNVYLRKPPGQRERDALNEDPRRGVDAPPPLPDVTFSSPKHLPSHAPISPYSSPPHPDIYTPSPIPQLHALPYIPPVPLTPRVYLHPVLAAPSLQYDMRYPPDQSNLRLSLAVLAEPASSPPLPSLPIRVSGLPWHCIVRPDPKLSPGNAVVTIQDVLVSLYLHLRTTVKTDEYNAMGKARKAEIFQVFERRVGHDPGQRGKGLRRVDFLGGHCIAQGLVRAQSKDDVWDVVVAGVPLATHTSPYHLPPPIRHLATSSSSTSLQVDNHLSQTSDNMTGDHSLYSVGFAKSR